MTAQTQLPEPVYPDGLAWEGRRITIGSKGYALLALLMKSGGCVSVANAKATAFGDATANRNKLDSLIWRANRKLASLGCLARIAVDGPDVLIV